MVFWKTMVPRKNSTLCISARGMSVSNGARVKRVTKLSAPAKPPRAVPCQWKKA